MNLKLIPLMGAAVFAAPAFAITVNMTDFTFASPSEVTTAGTQSYTGQAGQFSGVLGGASFTAYCAELTQNFYFNTSYDYSLVTGASYFTSQKVTDLSRLFTAAQGFVVNTYTSAAMQAAVWEIIYDTGTSYDLTSGAFTVVPEDSADTATFAALTTVNGFLAGLSSYAASYNVNVLFNPNQQDFIVATIPEPETWALLAAGLGVLGLMARRNRV